MLILLVWLIVGMLLTMVMIPVIAFKKSKGANKKVGFLNSLKVKKQDYTCRQAAVIAISIITLPLSCPILYIGVLVYVAIVTIHHLCRRSSGLKLIKCLP